MTEQKQQQIIEYVPFGGEDKIKLSIVMVRDLLAVPTRSGKQPSDRDIIRYMMLCQARRLNPWEGDAYLIGYDGRDGTASFSLITAHQAFLKRAELHPEYDGMESGVIVKLGEQIEEHVGDLTVTGETLLGGWATVYFKTRKHPMRKRLKLSRFQKPFGVWQDDPAGMIVKCAEADALRSSFPTMLGGLYTQEESAAVPPMIDVPRAEIPVSVKDKIVEAVVGMDTPSPIKQEAPSSTPAPAAPPPPLKRGPGRPPKKKLQIKADISSTKAPLTPETHPFRSALKERLALGQYSEEEFLELANFQEWLGRGKQWSSMDQVPDDMFEVFLSDEEWPTVMEALDKMREKQTLTL